MKKNKKEKKKRPEFKETKVIIVSDYFDLFYIKIIFLSKKYQK